MYDVQKPSLSVTRSCSRPKAHWGLLFVALALSSWGCGLNDYEKHQDDQRANLLAFDEENAALAGPLEMPMVWVENGKTKTQKDALPVKFFLRPPKGIVSKVKEKDGVFKHQEVSIYCYPGPSGHNVFFTDAKVDTREKPPPKPLPNTLNPKAFRYLVRGALMVYFQQEYKELYAKQETKDMVNAWFANDDLKKKVFQTKNLLGQPVQVEYSSQEFHTMPSGAKDEEKHRIFEVFFLVKKEDQAALIYEKPASKAKDVALAGKVEWSLKSMVLGGEALQKLHAFVMRGRR